jgi:bifunctional non-homologous end joining protein LigD
MEQTTLYFRQGSSDKVYQASIEQQNGGHVVNYAFGRRGTTLVTGTKTQTPIGYEEAKKIFDKLVSEKTAKGYTPGENGTPYQHTDKENRSAGIRCQLLNPISEAEATRLIDDPAFCLQEKIDGRRLLIQKKRIVVSGINRLGLFVGLSETIARAASKSPHDFVMDGEAVGETLYAFDLLEIGGLDLRNKSYRDRYAHLAKVCDQLVSKRIALVATAFSKAEKALQFCTFKAMKAEGVVFKELNAPYVPGRPTFGGSQLKLKFCETASFIVSHLNAKRSVALMLLDGDKTVPIGNVTIPANQQVPVMGAIVECRYLYAFTGGSIFQPVYLGQRDDIPAEECTLNQLKFKPDLEKAVA